MEGPSSRGPEHPPQTTTTTTAKMVETGTQQPQQLPGGGPTVPESDEATTTNPSMNGLEAHFTSGEVVVGEQAAPTTSSALSVASPSSSSSSSNHINSPTSLTTTTQESISSSGQTSTTTSSAASQQPSSAVEQPPNTQSIGGATPSTSSEGTTTPQQQQQQQRTTVEQRSVTKSTASESERNEETDASLTTDTVSPVVPEKRVGCAHYKRRAKFVTPCCNKLYMCRYCHDEHETHYFNRKTVTQLICTECDTRQRVQAECEKCGVRFGKYTCLVCNLFDDEDKNQYHCDGCGICRIGGKDRFFHCEVCNMCLPMQLKIDGHRCVENVSRSNCPVCLEDIHTSRIPCHIPDCGHLLHRTCFEDLLSSGHYACPTCQTSMIDMKKLWDYLDAEVENTPMPNEYASHFVNILCKDCHKESKIAYHVVGLKCGHCGAYNTCQTGTGANEEGAGGDGEAATGPGGEEQGGEDGQQQPPPPPGPAPQG